MTSDYFTAWKNERTALIAVGEITADDVQYFEDDRDGVLSRLGLSVVYGVI